MGPLHIRLNPVLRRFRHTDIVAISPLVRITSIVDLVYHYRRNPVNLILPIFRTYSLLKRDVVHLYAFANVTEYVASVRNMQETIRQRDGEIYALQSKVIELERQLECYRRSEAQRNVVESPRRPFKLC